MILTIITFIFLSLTFYNGITFFIDDPKLIKKIYFGKAIDYLWAFILFLGVVSVMIPLSLINLPKILTFSWLQLIGSNGKNLIASPSSGPIENPLSFFLLILFYISLIFFLPYLAKLEEIAFRSMKFELKDRIFSSVKFGFIHMIVGVPVIVAIVLSFIGFVFSIKYVRSVEKSIKKYEDSPNEFPYEKISEDAIDDTTSLHTKYNFILISLLLFITIISHYYK